MALNRRPSLLQHHSPQAEVCGPNPPALGAAAGAALVVPSARTSVVILLGVPFFWPPVLCLAILISLYLKSLYLEIRLLAQRIICVTPGKPPSIRRSPFVSAALAMVSTAILASSYGGSHIWPVAASMCASLNPTVETSIVPSTIGSVKRRGPIKPGLKTIPLSPPMNGTCEWPHTTSRAPSAFAVRATSARNLGP